MIDHAILMAAREYFTKTKTHKSWLEPIKSSSPRAIATEYEFEIPDQTEVFEICKATANGSPIDVKAFNQLPADPTRHTSTAGQALIPKNTNTYVLSSAILKGNAIQVMVTLRPTLDADGIDEEMASQHFEAIGFGARANLLEVPGTFFNADLHIKYRNDFLNSINAEKIAAWKGNTQLSTGTNKRMFV